MERSSSPAPSTRVLAIAALVAASLGSACTAIPEAQAPGSPTPEELRAAGYTWPPKVAGAAASPPPAATTTERPANETKEGAPASAKSQSRPLARGPLPQGDCLAALASAGVAFDVLDEKRGVDTPVVVSGPLGGVGYYTHARTPLVLDCRLALALLRVGPALTRHGVTRARFSGAYVYRMSKKGRLSNHAYGLAIDLHEFEAGGRRYSVKRDFARGVECTEGPASAPLPLPNRIACELKGAGLFREMLTPDYDADHHDHFHLGLAPLEAPDTTRATASR